MLDSINNICITGMGMVSSLGLDVVTCCAAARAGIVRSEELDYFRYRSPEDGAVESAIGHVVPVLTEGFEGFARILRLFQGGLANLQRQIPHAVWKSAHTAFYLSLANSRRVYTGLNLIQTKEIRQRRAEEAQEAEEYPQDDDGIVSRLLETASRASAWPDEPFLQFVTTSGHSGVAEALGKALYDLRAGRVEVAVVGGVDSLLEEDTLLWLQSAGRLKTAGIASSLQPGEAGAFLLLETIRNARLRGAPVFGIVENLRLGKEVNTLLSGDTPRGVGLMEVISGIIDNPGRKNTYPAWLITDQNGEPYRAMEWGNAMVRLTARSQVFAEPVLWYPAVSFGDTGAASGAVSLCMASCAFDRGYAPSKRVAVISSSDGVSRAAVLLKAPEK